MFTSTKLRTIAVIAIIFIQGFLFPLSPIAVVAQTSGTPTDTATDSTSTTESGGESANQGPTKPTGADAVEYVYNKETGMWESDKYIWDPATNTTTPKQEQNYSYNPETGRWDTTEWVYQPESGEYVENKKSTPNNPDSTKQSPTTSSTTTSPTSQPAATTTNSNGADSSGSTVDTTGPDSSNQINSNNNNSGTFNNWYNAEISNNSAQSTRSGDASVLQNTVGGDATSGDAASRADIINMLQSSWGLSDTELTTFTANLPGDIYGDLILNTGPDSNNQINSDNDTQLTINNETNNRIINNIEANSVSGDATVSGNTQGGDATTGDASAMVNIINLLNSMIISGESFYGTINIGGNLEGDVLLPQAVLDSLIASTGPNSNNEINSDNDTDIDADVSNSTTMNNNVDSRAQSGDATVARNTEGGNASTGNASTDTRIVNLVGNDISAQDSLLVFVSVFGEWVGMITHAPGANAALLGTGVNSNNQINSNNDTDIDLNSTTNNLIENNVNVSAQSGNAEVSNNTTGGNATSGDASTSVNIFNMVDSTLNIENWFGVLHLNILGNWNGSFGIDTAFGDSPQPTVSNTNGNSEKTTGAENNSTNEESPRPSFSFRPLPDDQTAARLSTEQSQTVASSADIDSSVSADKPSNADNNSDDGTVASAQDDTEEGATLNPLPFIGGMVALTLIGGERAYSRRKNS